MATDRSAPRRIARRDGKNRPGLTLIELVVVLTILTAIGSLLVPVFGSMLARTHMAKCSVTIPEISKLVQTEFAATLRLPNTLDSLLNDDGTTLFVDLPGNSSGPVGGQVTPYTLVAGDADALALVGLRNVVDADAAYTSDDDATIDSFPPGLTPRDIVDGDVLVGLDQADAEALFFLPGDTSGTHQYLLFGLGNNSSLVGAGNGRPLNEAPTHFGDTAEFNPADVYQRYGLVFRLQGDAADDEREAVFIGAAAIHGGGLENAEEHRKEFWELSQGG
jgi:type II secretory pathway pseudopilin PulG